MYERLLHTRVGAALSTVALLALFIAIFLRPQPLPGGAAHYSSTVPAPGQAVPGHTYHIDTIAVGRRAPALAAEPQPVTVGEPVVVAGWAIDPLTLRPAAGLEFTVDRGRAERVQSYGVPRPDVAAALGNAAVLNCGFQATIATAKLAAGPHRVRFLVTAAGGRISRLPEDAQFTVQPSAVLKRPVVHAP
jgi:hypothetical protein